MAAEGSLHGPSKLRLKSEEARKASSPSLCAFVRTVPWADEAEQQLSRWALSGCELSADVRFFGEALMEAFCKYHLSYVWSFKGQDKQAAPVSASVRAVPWADEAEQQLSRLALSTCELSADIRIFGAGLLKAPCTDHLSYVSSLRWQEKQEAPVSVPLCEQCHGQMRLSNSFPGELFLPASYLQTFAFSEHGCRMPAARTPKATFEAWWGKTSKQPQSLCLSASSAMGRWCWPRAFQA